MSEGLAEVRLLSSGYMSTACRWPCGAHVSEISEAHFQIGAVFINKLQILVLNNYILTWNTCFQWRQALSVVAQHVWFRHSVTHLPRKNKATSASNHRPSAPWVLPSAGKLIRSDICTCPTSCLIVPQTFSSFVFYRPSLSFCHLSSI